MGLQMQRSLPFFSPPKPLLRNLPPPPCIPVSIERISAVDGVELSPLMALRDHPKRQHISFWCSTSFLTLSLLSLASVVLIFSISRSSQSEDVPSLREDNKNGFESRQGETRRPEKSCNYSKGTWIYDPTVRSRYDNTCKEIFKGWNCISNNKTNARDLTLWRWQPNDCDLSPLDPLQFLERFRDKSIGFIGDSLNRNMFVSLVCTLKSASSDVKKWRPVGADRGFTFLQYNLTVAYHRTILLARYGRWSDSGNGGALESLGYKQGFRVDVDVPEGSWANAPSFHDIIILNTGHWWWAPSKFDPIKSPMLFFENGLPVLPPITPELGLDMTLKYMIAFVERMSRASSLKLFRTQSPRHFEGGDWNEGGSCQREKPLLPEQVEDFFALENNGTDGEARLVNRHLYKALKGASFRILDITHMSELRADAHPSTAGGKKHDDCMHWCLPGVTDTWNDLLVAFLNNM